ncbi:WD repeat-containing protein 87, partial [Plakobranchus ocellatus]
PITAPPPMIKLTKEEELTLLQKIVKEEWFPPGIPPILDLVNDELTKLLETTDTKVFVAVCDYVVQIFQQLSIAPKFLNRASDKLTKQLNGPSAIARKKAVWTMKQLGLAAKKDVVAALLPGLLDAKEGAREELISNLGELLSGPGAADGLSSLMSSLGITNKPLGTKEEQQAAIKAISEKLQAEAEKLKNGSAESVKQRVEMWVSSLNLPSDGSFLQSRTSNSRALDSSGAPRGASSGLETEGSFEKSSRQSTRGSRRKSRGGGKKKGTKSRRKSRQKSGQPGEDKDDLVSVDMSVQTDPRSEDALDEDDLLRRRRGRWRRGGLSEFREAGDLTDEEDDFTGDDDDDYDDDEGAHGDTEDDEGRPRRVRRRGKDSQGADDQEVEESTGIFTRIEYDLTPGPGRPKGASVHKFYARRDQVATIEQDPSKAGGLFPTMPSIEEPFVRPKDPLDRLDPNDRDSDLHSESEYTTISKSFTAKDGVSVGDSGIGKDIMSDTSSHMYGDSLYEQGRPRLSPIKSQTKLNAENKKEPDWKDFFESEKVQEKRKTVGFSRKDTVQGEPQIYDQSGRIAVLPPIMYVDPEHPTLPGEAGLRLLHSIRWADKDKSMDGGGRLVEALPGRLTITTHDE